MFLNWTCGLVISVISNMETKVQDNWDVRTPELLKLCEKCSGTHVSLGSSTAFIISKGDILDS